MQIKATGNVCISLIYRESIGKSGNGLTTASRVSCDKVGLNSALGGGGVKVLI